MADNNNQVDDSKTDELPVTTAKPLVARRSSTIEERTTRTLIIGVDESEMSEFAFNYMVEAVYRSTDLVILAHIQPKSILKDVARAFDSSAPVYERLGSALRQENLEIIQKYTRLCQDNSIRNVRQEVVVDHDGIGPTLVKLVGKYQEVRALGSVILIVGSRELGFFGRAFTGSTSDYCLHNSPGPVIVAKMGLRKKEKDDKEAAAAANRKSSKENQ
eukprot:TRINITY_DN2557_c0_g1_i1.p1 TRINITY_DN2557_c0_g1~~TRINITY_DN2557_c0_g1_i1.p1  ORF type:complete len:217 (-),score=53.80 TRINITY_DN2557_c0_g1_i1:49-699(-)